MRLCCVDQKMVAVPEHSFKIGPDGKIIKKKIDVRNSHCMQMVHNSHWIVIFIVCVDQISLDCNIHCLC